MEGSNWQPITTAPRDGTEILASDLDCIDIVSWDEWEALLMTDWRKKVGWTNREGEERYPCHWQPLPDHPEVEP